MSWIRWIVLAVILFLSVGSVVHTWRVAHGRTTTRSKLFGVGWKSNAMMSSDRAWQRANQAMLPGDIVMLVLYLLFLVLGILMQIVWTMPIILLLALGVSIYTTDAGNRAARRAWVK